jgi:hypothetical protein
VQRRPEISKPSLPRKVMSELEGDFLDNRELKVKWESVIKSSSFFQMKGMRYKLLGTIIAVAPNGGYIALTSDKNVAKL